MEVSERKSDDPELLSYAIAPRLHNDFNAHCCARDLRQITQKEAGDMFRALVWSVLLRLDETEYRLVHKSEMPEAMSVSERINSYYDPTPNAEKPQEKQEK